ncbi:hypothetical protein GCM10023094_34910 [Rhodococcus olei]|uniref:Short subunit dehydrogenase n=1 Tax=Rhodococcus olei TaxID=2161675 RepID=A0ABP8PB44_9NOCA
MDLQLGGTTAVVTGASKGIGLAITAALVGQGAHVVAGAGPQCRRAVLRHRQAGARFGHRYDKLAVTCRAGALGRLGLLGCVS